MGTKGVILVTGACGRIGTRVIQRFCKDYNIVAFDIVEPKQQYENTEFVKMDLSSDENVAQGFELVRNKYGNNIVSMIHLAAYYSFSGAHPELYDVITVHGTGRLLKELQNFECEQFLFSSTQLVMATCEVGETINEDSPVNPTWDYPLSKVKTEELMKKERGNIPFVSLRIAGCYDDECHSIPISNQIQRLFEHQLASHLFPGDITHGAPFLHMDDLVDCIEICVDKRKELDPELILLISEDRTLSTDQMQRLISRCIDGKEITTYRIPKWFAKFGAWAENALSFGGDTFIKPWMIDLADQHFVIDVSKAKQVIGWSPKNFVGDVIPRMIEELKQDPLKWYEMNSLKAPTKIKRKYSKS